MSKDSKYEQTNNVLTFHPTGEYYFNKGLKAYHQRDLYKAKKLLERAMFLEPAEPLIACQLSIIYTDLGEYGESNKLLENIVADLDPFMTECHYFLANNYAHLGMFKEAYKHANEYLQKDKLGEFAEDAEDLVDLILYENDETEESLFEQDSIIQEQEKARAYLESGNFKKAIEVLNETIEEHPEFWFAYNNLALAQFYLGRTNEAFATLETVLEKNPGNLHALCNMLVFYHYERNEAKVAELAEALEKVRAILPDQQYKLGATFALIGEYRTAYAWLKQLQRKNFDGDDTFYYWIANCAYHLGYEESSRNAWKKVIEINPKKEGLEPWGDDTGRFAGYEHQVSMITKKLRSEFLEERLFGLFLYKHCFKKELIDDQAVRGKDGFVSPIEKSYAELLLTGKCDEADVQFMDAVLDILYSKHHPVSLVESGLYILWFSVFESLRMENGKFTNPAAWAAAAEYVWMRLRDEKVTQKEIAAGYDLSVATVRKYINKVNSVLN